MKLGIVNVQLIFENVWKNHQNPSKNVDLLEILNKPSAANSSKLTNSSMYNRFSRFRIELNLNEFRRV